jgi:hypothetical protein
VNPDRRQLTIFRFFSYYYALDLLKTLPTIAVVIVVLDG